MRVSDLTSGKLSVPDGSEVTIEGIFVMVHGVGYLVESKENKDQMELAIAVRHPDLERRLLKRVPALGGSKYSYSNNARISGKLSMSVDPDFWGVIDAIHDFTVYIEELSFSVEL
ncbi:hypothetical protein LFL96_00290 [Paraburkholderia sp. D15]|uniref:hypothetical protein n=1 Tax=Paraburkholderia sp. D15 TaxID=2880218 RepID=UPI002478C7DF|nr:hypothetical protein [Paraburkholderia sp. D15]WGS49991.1 hypothetical protein LFL96_00290 [Paraburkholderia sp. D15]